VLPDSDAAGWRVCADNRLEPDGDGRNRQHVSGSNRPVRGAKPIVIGENGLFGLSAVRRSDNWRGQLFVMRSQAAVTLTPVLALQSDPCVVDPAVG